MEVRNAYGPRTVSYPGAKRSICGLCVELFPVGQYLFCQNILAGHHQVEIKNINLSDCQAGLEKEKIPARAS